MPEISENIVDNATRLIDDLRTTKFLSGSLATLQNLPPTTDAFCQHLKRAALSTILMKSAHIARIPEIQFDKYGWHLVDKTLCPVKMAIDAFPKKTQKLEQSVKCNCKMRCARNCTCFRNNVQCYCVLCIVCACKGEIDNNDD